MIFGWLDRKAEQTQRNEADKFIVSLKGADLGLIDTVHGNAMFWAEFHRRKGKDLYEMANWIFDKNEMWFPLTLGKMIKDQQKHGRFSTATGLMVWLFSARAILQPELRLGGRELWEQLSRSTFEAEMIAGQSCLAMEYSTNFVDHSRIPFGLEKLSN